MSVVYFTLEWVTCAERFRHMPINMNHRRRNWNTEARENSRAGLPREKTPRSPCLVVELYARTRSIIRSAILYSCVEFQPNRRIYILQIKVISKFIHYVVSTGFLNHLARLFIVYRLYIIYASASWLLYIEWL